MTIKQFKKRWLHSKIEPELFYMPVEKKEKEELFLHITTFNTYSSYQYLQLGIGQGFYTSEKEYGKYLYYSDRVIIYNGEQIGTYAQSSRYEPSRCQTNYSVPLERGFIPCTHFLVSPINQLPDTNLARQQYLKNLETFVRGGSAASCKIELVDKEGKIRQTFNCSDPKREDAIYKWDSLKAYAWNVVVDTSTGCVYQGFKGLWYSGLDAKSEDFLNSFELIHTFDI